MIIVFRGASIVNPLRRTMLMLHHKDNKMTKAFENRNMTSSVSRPTDYEPVSDPVAYFIQNRRAKLWQKNSEKWKHHFRLQLRVLKLFIESNASERHIAAFVYRLGLGYWGIGQQSGITSGIISLDALETTGEKTSDHLIGAQLIGKIIHEAFVACNFDEDHMADKWLFENIWLWMTIKVTKAEHHRNNILKTVNDLEGKMRLAHYVNVSKLVVKMKTKNIISRELCVE